MRSAIRLGQIQLVYQPIFLLEDGVMVEVEALMRWTHGERGPISPAIFIPLAEKSGYIVELGLWGLEQACMTMGALHESAPNMPRLRLSVNLSPRQFQSPSLLMDIDRILGVTGFDPSYLTLEITEDVLMREFDRSVVVLNALKRRGIKVAIDDFGTGYSSLSYLKRLPVDVLKIDQSFVRGLCDSVEDAALVEAVLTLARTLGLYVTAEGIETAGQASTLRDMRCEQGQGFHFSRPMAADKLLSAIQSHATEKLG